MTANGNLTPPVALMLTGRFDDSAAANPARRELMHSQTGIGQKDLMLAAETLEATNLDPQLALAARALVAFAMQSPG